MINSDCVVSLLCACRSTAYSSAMLPCLDKCREDKKTYNAVMTFNGDYWCNASSPGRASLTVDTLGAKRTLTLQQDEESVSRKD